MSTITQTIIDGIASITGLDSILDSNGNARFVSTLGTPIATTSGVSVDITGIPSGVKEIDIIFDSVSSAGTNQWLVQIGDVGGIEDTGYDSEGHAITTTVAGGTSTAGFVVRGDQSASRLVNGIFSLKLKDASAFRWVANHVLGDTTASNALIAGSGIKSLTAELSQIRLTTAAGSALWDGGSITIQYRF